jgi:glycosyltransferase involved in cell wall biosynthesis
MSQQDVRIAYVNQIYPLLTETFIYREVLGLEREGLDVSTYAIWKPDTDGLSQESRHMVDSTGYVFPLSWPKFIAHHLYFLFRHPRKYLGTLSFVLTRKGESAKNRLRTLYHFCEAVFLAPDIKRKRIQHVHAHFSINAATVALVISRLLDISFSFTPHNNFFYDQLILKEKIKEARFIVAISEFNRRFIAKLLPEQDFNYKIHTVHYGLSVDDFAPPAVKPSNDIPIILFVSQLAERKGTPYLVKACKILVERGLTFRCVIVGDGPQRELLEQLVVQCDLQEIVELVGAVLQENLKEYLEKADIFAVPCVTVSSGDMDGLPNVLIEAMAMEIPTISTYVSGVPELIEDEQCGLLVNEKDKVALADALQRLLEDKELRARLGKNGRQKVVQEFNIDKNTTRLATLFKKYTSDPFWFQPNP